MSFRRGPTNKDGVRLCQCGCGQVAKRHISDGRFKSWRSYAPGHAPNERVVIRVPEDQVDLAYAAGIIDGEGCIYARVRQRGVPLRGGPLTFLMLQVTMCSEVVIKWLEDSFGGSAYSSVLPDRARRFSWQVRGGKVAIVLEALLPYLKEKRERARLAIALARRIESNHNQKLSLEEIGERSRIAMTIKAFNRNPSGEDIVVN